MLQLVALEGLCIYTPEEKRVSMLRTKLCIDPAKCLPPCTVFRISQPGHATNQRPEFWVSCSFLINNAPRRFWILKHCLKLSSQKLKGSTCEPLGKLTKPHNQSTTSMGYGTGWLMADQRPMQAMALLSRQTTVIGELPSQRHKPQITKCRLL